MLGGVGGIFMPSLPELMPTQVSDETFGGVTYHIAGELVPVLSVDVTQMPLLRASLPGNAAAMP